MAWIIYRDVSRVNRLHDRPSSPWDVLNTAVRDADGDQAQERACLSARDELISKLKSGTIEAFGISVGQPIHAPIPCLAWETINTLHEYDERVGPLDVGYDGSPLYRNVLVDAEVIQNLWPHRPQLATDDDVRGVIRGAMRDNGGFVGQAKGAEIVRERFPDFPKKRAMALVKEATGNDRPGPRGPRRNRAG